jgi:hypothetical protein
MHNKATNPTTLVTRLEALDTAMRAHEAAQLGPRPRDKAF